MNRKSLNYAWVIVAVMCAGVMIMQLDKQDMNFAILGINKSLKLDPTLSGNLLSAYVLPYAIANLFIGWFIDRFGTKKVLIVGGVAWSLATFAMGFCHSYSSLYLVRGLIGVAEAPLYPCVVVAVRHWFVEEKRAVPTVLTNVASQVLGVVAPPIVTAIMFASGWNQLFITLGLFSLVFPILLAIFYKNPQQQTAGVKKNAASAKDYQELFKKPSMWVLMVGCFGVMGTSYGFNTWLPSYLLKVQHMTILKTGLISMLPAIVGIFGSYFNGLETNLVAKHFNISHMQARKWIAGIASVGLIVLLFPIIFIKDTTAVVTLISCANFFAVHLSGSPMLITTYVAPSKTLGTIYSIENFFGNIGSFLAPIIIGAIIAATKNYNAIFFVCIAFALISLIFYGVLPKMMYSDEDDEVKIAG